MDIPSLISSAAAIFAVVYAKKAFDESRKANEIANKQLEEETKVEPKLYFPLISKRDNKGNFCGYQVLCVNNGKGIAVINDVHQRKQKDFILIDDECDEVSFCMHGNEIVRPNDNICVVEMKKETLSKLLRSPETFKYKIEERSTNVLYEIIIKVDKYKKRVFSEVKIH